eukprot:GHVT01069170.1.p2 GENE.GHVT01069170.1~~GHVT01069170.1.p2  ORF type:complete len:124 (-),score=6.27 GHVT01069170.1:385-756(-)
MGCYAAVPQDSVYVIETCGKFNRVADPGFACVGVPGVCTVAGRVNLRTMQLTVSCETKTRDNVFLLIAIAVQYRVIRKSVYEAFYTLADPVKQIQTYVYDVVRAVVPKQNLDEVFGKYPQTPD